MTANEWRAVCDRAWRHGMSAAEHGMYQEARFWLGRARLAGQRARRLGMPIA